jgi:hypothetical protein
VKAKSQANSRKRPVNPILSTQAKSTTVARSTVVERLLSEYVTNEQREKLARAEAGAKTVVIWNKFNTSKSSFADEYSTL